MQGKQEKLFVVNREMLGQREIGFSLWDGNEVVELTRKQVEARMKVGIKVLGFKITEDGLDLDNEEFFAVNVMEHRSCGNYKPMISIDLLVKVFYVLVGVRKVKGLNVYDFITSTYARETLSEEDVINHLRMGIISAGVKLEDDKLIVSSLIGDEK